MDLTVDYAENLATRFLPLANWKFVKSEQSETILVYNSPWCRLRFHIHVDWNSRYLILGYGRLHAIADQSSIQWQGQECHCWHNNSGEFRILLQYLDGLSPEEAYTTSQRPLLLSKDFETSVLTSHPDLNSLELECVRHAKVWERYGLRFFELFDLRRPDLWNDYIGFLKEYHRLHDEKLDADLARRGQTRTPPTIPPYRRC